MKLKDFEVNLASPLGTAKGTITERRGTLISVGIENSDTLPVGIGEATPLPGWTESVAECRQALAARSGDTPEEALAALSGRPAARHGVSLALADATARQAEQSLATYLADGDAVRDSVPVNATIGVGDPEQAATAAEQAVAEGFETLKIKVGAGELSNDIDRVRAVEAAVSDTISVRVDANGAWTPSTAREAVESFAALGIEYVEQPVPADQLDAMTSLRGHGVEIAADEALATHDPAAVLSAEAADVLVLKPMALGGVDRAREVALSAYQRGVDTVVTTTIDAAVARTAAVHLAASLPTVRACGFATAQLLESDLVADPVPVEDGRVQVPDGPGAAGDRFVDLV
jgi:o-succinylbenzoate synthase